MTTPEIGRQVRRNENDVKAIYGLIDETNRTVREIAATQQEHGTKLAGLQQSADIVADRTDRIDDKVLSLSSDVRELARGMSRLSGRMDRFEDTQRTHSEVLDKHSAKLDEHGTKLDEILSILRGKPTG